MIEYAVRFMNTKSTLEECEWKRCEGSMRYTGLGSTTGECFFSRLLRKLKILAEQCGFLRPTLHILNQHEAHSMEFGLNESFN